MRYTVHGPYEIPLGEGEFKKRIDREDIKKFWATVDSALAGAYGCYIFAIEREVNKVVTPWYVGKAQKQTFYKECFTDHKVRTYHDALEKSRGKGKPLMFFLARRSGSEYSPESESSKGYSDIDFVENMFIALGCQRNSDIRNKRGTHFVKNVEIEGFHNHKHKGRLRETVQALQKVF